ncbi:MAG TPA: hypothetical protein VF017_13985 [Thermoanaerobaculia bacterium]|nr:hypothetical protein [Thermoanaerobaculia bacterium]
MRVPQQRVAFTVLLLAAVHLSLSGCATRGHNQGHNAAFLEAAKAAGVSVRGDEIVTHRSGTQTVAIAPVTTWERTPATALRSGVDVAFVHLSNATQAIPAGYYTLRASADVSKIGTAPASIQFIDRQGKVAGNLEAVTEVHSLTIPEQASTRRTFVTIGDEPRPGSPSERVIIIVLCCPNGDCLIIVIL